jgi:hypothetical protein
MTEKIHCDLLDITGIDWDGVTEDHVSCIIRAIHEMELMDERGELFGFVGTADIDSVVGGFFVVQFPTEFLSYDRDRTAQRQRTTPAERVFFLVLLKAGRVLLQNRRFQVLPIDMSIVQRRLTESLRHVLQRCGIGPLVSLVETRIRVSRDRLIETYRSSNRVTRLQVHNPNPGLIPEDFVYYNPQRQRNRILRDSRLHDYPKLREIDLAAKRHEDLRDTHLGQDLVHATPERARFILEFEDEESRHRVLRRLVRPKFEFHIDMDSEKVSEEDLLRVIRKLQQEAALDIDSFSDEPSSRQLELW